MSEEGAAAPGDGEQVTDWKVTAGLPEYMHNWDEAKGTQDEFWQSVDFRRAQAGRSIILPGEDATPEDQTAFRTRLMEKVPDLIQRPGENATEEELADFHRALGVPEDVNAYVLEHEVAPESLASVRDLAKRYGLSPDQFKGLFGELAQAEIQASEEHTARQEQTVTTMKSEWGEAYDQNMDRLKNTLEVMGAPDDLKNAVANNNAGAETLKWLHEWTGKFIGEDHNVAMMPQRGRLKMTPAEIHNRKAEIQNMEGYQQSSHPDHQRLVQEMVQLNEQLNVGAPDKTKIRGYGGRAVGDEPGASDPYAQAG